MSSSLISPLFFLTGTGMILVALSAVWYWQRGNPSLWPMVWWGVLAWTASLALKAAAGLPMMNFFQRHADNLMIWLCGGLLTGVFECVIPLLLILKRACGGLISAARSRSVSVLVAPKRF